MKEEWKPISGFEGMYSISNMGVIMSHPRLTTQGIVTKGKVLSQNKNNCGYRFCGVSVDGKRSYLYIHRNVAKAFIPNPNGYGQINHKNGDKNDNRYVNLEWCSASQNMRHFYDTLGGEGPKKEIIGFNEGIEIKYPSLTFAAECLGLSIANISACIAGRRKTSGGLYWRFYEVDNDDKIGHKCAELVTGEPSLSIRTK